MDTTTLEGFTDGELTGVIEAAQRIIARRAATARIPAQVEELAREYRESGGDTATLVEAIAGADV